MKPDNKLQKIKMGDNVSLNQITDDFHIFQMKDKAGYGEMRMNKVLEGIYIMYNDFHMQSCSSQLQTNLDLFCVDHCREGRIENEVDVMNYSYIEAGDLRVDNRHGHDSDFFFPLSHYHGMTIAFFLDQAQNALSENFKNFPVNLRKLREKFLTKSTPFILRKDEQIGHIFAELYHVPMNIRKYYIRIKIYELLLFLSAVELPEAIESRPYFYKPQVEKIKSIRKLMTENLDRHFTLKELSEDYNVSLTSLKKCFKGVYGMSVFSYMRTYRMNRAASLLKNTSDSVAVIALEVGYNSPSKFSTAFKEIIGFSPLEYRKSPVQMEHIGHYGAENLY